MPPLPGMLPIPGGAAPTQQPQLPDDMDKVREALAKVLYEHLSAPQPQAPQAPVFQGLPGYKAAAAAMNPQLAPQIIQQEMAPDMARYQTQQQAFENAMSQKQQAIQTAGQLAGRDITGQYGLMRPSRAMRLNKSEFVKDINGQPRRFRQFTDPMTGAIVPVTDPETGEQVNELDLGPSFVAPTVVPGMDVGPDGESNAGYFRTPRVPGQPTTRVQGPEGTRLEPPPPPGLATEAGGKVGVLKGIPRVMEVYNEVDSEVRGTGKLSEIKNWAASLTQGTRAASILMPDALQRYYAEMRAILSPYVRSVSGLVFPEAELRRYEARMPVPGVTAPDVAATLWDSLIQEMVRDIQAKYGAMGRTPPPTPGTTQPESTGSPELQEYMKRKGITVKP